MRSTTFFLFLIGSIQAAYSQNDLPPLEQALSGVVTIGIFDVSDNDVTLGFAEAKPSYARIAYEKKLDMGDVFSTGSGFVIELDGRYYIVTNAHVIDSASGEKGSMYAFSVTRDKYSVRLVGGDTFYDIAILEFDDEELGSEIIPLTFADHEAQVAEKVYSIGNPLGNFPYTITDGIISGKNRQHYRPTTGRFGFLQHTATLSSGNSGGPLVSEKGEVLGINTFIGMSKDGSYPLSQLNFALEGRRAMRLIRSIIDNDGRLRRAFLGVEFAATTALNPYEPDGAPFINSVLPGSPAYNDLQDKTGYTVTHVNGEAVQNLQDIVRMMEAATPGTPVSLKLHKQIARPEITITAGELTNERLEGIAQYFFQKYSDYEPQEDASGVALVRRKDGVKLDRFISAGQGSDDWATFQKVDGKDKYGIGGLGGMTRQGQLGTYQVKSLQELGVIVRLCTIERQLAATLVEGEEYAGTVRFNMQDDDFNEIKTLYY